MAVPILLHVDFKAAQLRSIAIVAADITRAYLRDQTPVSQKGGVARAAMIMAAQQQQQQ